MKRIFLLFIFILSAFIGNAQLTSLSENFDATCVSAGQNYQSNGWTTFNSPHLANDYNWNCVPVEGRAGTPGVSCTNYDFVNDIKHVDTAWLFTPTLDLSNYSQIYIRFDSKVDTIFVASKLDFYAFTARGADTTDPLDSMVGNHYLRATNGVSPQLSPADVSGWVTHEIDITGLHFSHSELQHLNFAFRYIGDLSLATEWYLDNIFTTQQGMSALDLKGVPERLSMNIIGNSSTDKIVLQFNTRKAGKYELAVYDLQGRQVYNGSVNATGGMQNYTIADLRLSPGMYFVKMTNATTYGAVKTIVE